MNKPIHAKTRRILLVVALLLALTLLTRMWPLLYRLTPFGFDHGKDSIAILTMLVSHTPKLIGPWTSIPGVFFGPGWYYLLAPAYLLSGGDPVSAVWLLILLALVQAILVWKVWGVRAAILVTLAPLYIITSSSAWNPFPMTLISFGILALTWKIASKQQLSALQAVGLGLLAGFGFHFSAAFSIFYLPYVLIIPWLFTTQRRLLRTILIAMGISIPFIPQFVFELRHGFVQTQALFTYFVGGEQHAFSFEKILTVVAVAAKEMSLGLFPVLNGSSAMLPILNAIILVVLGSGYLYLLYRWWLSSQPWQKKWALSASIFLVIIPIVGFFFLHFNVWYVYGMVPVVTILAAFGLNQCSRKIAAAILLVFICVSAWNVYTYLTVDVPQHRQSTMLLAKERALDYILTAAAGEPFSVYVYVPDIYDYSYQYLWFRRAYQGQDLPVDFSYQPEVTGYITDKPALLAQFKQQSGPAKRIFYIIEKPGNQQFYDQWWSAQKPGQLITEQQINENIRVLVTKPATAP